MRLYIHMGIDKAKKKQHKSWSQLVLVWGKVTNAPFINLSIREVFLFCKSTQWALWITYLLSVAAAQMPWYLWNMNVIVKS